MSATYEKNEKLAEFIISNKEEFEEKLLGEAVNVAAKINEILQKGNIDLLKNAQRLVLYVIRQQQEELSAFAEQEGVAWAEHSLTLSFKLEWVQAIRRTLWQFLYRYDEHQSKDAVREEFYQQEKLINDQVDEFLNTFFLSYSHYKDQQLQSQKKLVENLSVPIIPISSRVAVLPLIGIIDPARMKTIEEKVLMGIADLKIQTLIMDLSGIAEMELDVIHNFQKVLDGIRMMGCDSVLTGLRAELVKKMIHAGVNFDRKAETKGTLQQTLKNYLTI